MATVANKRCSVSKKKRLDNYEKEIIIIIKKEAGVGQEYSLVNYTIQNIWRIGTKIVSLYRTDREVNGFKSLLLKWFKQDK